MGLRKKTIICIVVTLAVIWLIQVFVTQQILAKGFKELEYRNAHLNIGRVKDAIQVEMTNLSNKTMDWAAWDDTYHYVQGKNKNFEKVNLTPGSLMVVKINLFAFFDRNSNLVFGKFIDLKKQTTKELPAEFLEYLKKNSHLFFQKRDANDPVDTIVDFSFGPMLLSVRPIVTSELKGPSQGVLIGGILLDAEAIEKIGQVTHLKVSAIGVNHLKEPEHLSLMKQFDAEDSVIYQTASRKQAVAYGRFLDYFGNPALFFKIDIERVIWKQAISSIHAYFSVSLFGAIFLCIVMVLLIDRLVIHRVKSLDSQVHAIEMSGDLKQRVVVEGHDEIHHLAGAVNGMIHVIETADRSKSDYFAAMGHEIRTPMNAVMGLSKVLLDTPLTSEQAEYVKTIHASADSLLVLLNDILDFSKAESGKITLEYIPFDLKNICGEVVDLLFLNAKKRNNELVLDYSENLPAHFIGDSVRIRQILINLVGNAIKFTEQGQVRVRVSQPQGHPVGVRLEIIDTGVGLAPEKIPLLFSRFYQADLSISRKFGGTGLGLSISKMLVERMGGTIGVHSVLGQGSTFWFELPLAVTVVQQNRVAEVKQDPLVSTLRVLVAEDSVTNQKVIAKMLEKFRCPVEIVSDGAEAFERIKMGAIDLVFMDCQMPNVDGFEATQVIRKYETESKTRVTIVAVTANALDGDKEKCLSCGMDDYITKPLQYSDLERVLRRWEKTNSVT